MKLTEFNINLNELLTGGLIAIQPKISWHKYGDIDFSVEYNDVVDIDPCGSVYLKFIFI